MKILIVLIFILITSSASAQPKWVGEKEVCGVVEKIEIIKRGNEFLSGKADTVLIYMEDGRILNFYYDSYTPMPTLRKNNCITYNENKIKRIRNEN